MTHVEVGRIVPEDCDGLGWDVRVPFDGLYDALAVKRMVKLVNRRGRVRWITRATDSRTGEIRWSVFQPPRTKIAGLDELVEFIEEAVGVLAPDGLHVSFEDRFEARRFQRDLADLALTADEETQAKALEVARFKAVQALRRDDYPEPLRFTRKEGSGDIRGYQWLQMVEPASQDAAIIEAWMRRNLESRYWAASWQPGERVSPVKLSLRYWHLKAEQWQRLMDQSRTEPARLLIVHFLLPTDYHAFDRRFGPSSLS
jgi:hypothetical protein